MAPHGSIGGGLRRAARPGATAISSDPEPGGRMPE
jgi:hypothetical protein